MTASERGSAAVEFAMIVPVVVLLFGLVVGGARVWLARGVVEQAAAAAARGVSQARTPADARQAARDLASAQAAVDGLRCDRWVVEVDATALATAPGTPGAVSATVTCAVPLADVLVPGWPGSIDVRATSTSIVDRYRGRQ
ncbi:MAG: TadE/TadG family type IV pilus assembly protein [Propionicimonas sp.]|uniref:TadE/TadG family type IV pilus assembly protein n=1 Tax=Propionicimonas sp. TaxID=1955623 RepID=UPI003D09926F